MKRNTSNASTPEKQSAKDGPLDVLIGSPPAGNGSEPWFLMLKASQVKSKQGEEFRAFIKKGKTIEGNGWSHTYDGTSKWHQIDNEGRVSLACKHAS